MAGRGTSLLAPHDAIGWQEQKQQRQQQLMPSACDSFENCAAKKKGNGHFALKYNRNRLDRMPVDATSMFHCTVFMHYVCECLWLRKKENEKGINASYATDLPNDAKKRKKEESMP